MQGELAYMPHKFSLSFSGILDKYPYKKLHLEL